MGERCVRVQAVQMLSVASVWLGVDEVLGVDR